MSAPPRPERLGAFLPMQDDEGPCESLSFTEANVKAAFDHAQKLIYATDPQELIAHQSEYVKKQLAAMEEHAKELGVAVLKKITPDM
jgi:hypothetical protein